MFIQDLFQLYVLLNVLIRESLKLIEIYYTHLKKLNKKKTKKDGLPVI